MALVRQRPAEDHDIDAPPALRQRLESPRLLAPQSSWPTTLPYYQSVVSWGDRGRGIPFSELVKIIGQRHNKSDSCLTYLSKLNSPIMTLHIGQEGPLRRSFRVHMAMLTEAGQCFHNMFRNISRSGVVTFSEDLDDPDAWEQLIQWCYKGSLPPLEETTASTVFSEENTQQCWIRVKLCCLAEKFDMRLLQNVAMDSIMYVLQTT